MVLHLHLRLVDSSHSSNQVPIKSQIILGSLVTKLKQQASSSLHLRFKKFQTGWLLEVAQLQQSILSHCLSSPM